MKERLTGQKKKRERDGFFLSQGKDEEGGAKRRKEALGMWRWARRAREGISAQGGGCRQGPEWPHSLTEQRFCQPRPPH